VLVLGVVILFVFVLITILRIIQEYIVEKFQQRVFVEKSIEIAEKSHAIRKGVEVDEPIQKVMNYFFDITIIQKFFPVFLLDGVALVVNVIISLLLLLAFNIVLFELGIIVLAFYIAFLLLLGYNGIKYAIHRSDMKHETIYFLQRLPFSKETKEEALKKLDEILSKYVDARNKLFSVIIKQKTLSFFMQGIIIGGFLIVGGFLVINGKLPIGEFVASEIVVVSIISAINRFIKQIDYLYEVAEAFYKVGKLTKVVSIEDLER
jgi:ABC-type bacteriocin/lantibiotic exporter with double-glycine peptidase domain